MTKSAPSTDRRYYALYSLPVTHPSRNVALALIRAEYRNIASSTWHRVTKAYGIGKSTYNDLSGPWLSHNEWRAEDKEVTVCADCLKASCWQGYFYCETYKTADIKQMTVRELSDLHLENPAYWDENDVH